MATLVRHKSHDPRAETTVLQALTPGLLGGGLGALLNLAIYTGAMSAGVEMVGRFGPGEMPPGVLSVGAVVVASLVPGVIAQVMFLALEKWSRRPAATFGAIAAFVWLSSLLGPIGLADATLQTRLVLISMHAVAALAISLCVVGIQLGGAPAESQ